MRCSPASSALCAAGKSSAGLSAKPHTQNGQRASAMLFPGRTRRSAASSALCAAAMISAGRPSTAAAASGCTSSVCAAVAMKPSMWHARSLPPHKAPLSTKGHMVSSYNSSGMQIHGSSQSQWLAR